MTFPQNASEPAPRPTSIWPKVLAIGFGGLLVILLVVAGLVAANWSTLTGYYQQAKSAFSDMMTVQAALQKRYAADVRITAKSVSGVQGAILNVTLVNAPVMDRIKIDGSDGRHAALEVAAAARDVLPPGRGYDHYEVAFLRERGALGVSMSRISVFRFTAADLPTEKRPSAATGR
jgi:hypothetical protein